MRKALFLFLAACLVIGFSALDVQAKEWCWKMDPYSDVVKVSVFKPDPGKFHLLVNGRWEDTTNVFPVVGTIERSLSGTSLVMSIHGTRDDMSIWDLRAVLVPSTKSGTWKIKDSTGSYTNNGTFTRINCSTLAPLSDTALTPEHGGRATEGR